MRSADREWVRELIRRELNELRRETDARFLALDTELREQFSEAIGDLDQRLTHVHEKALRELTRRANERSTTA